MTATWTTMTTMTTTRTMKRQQHLRWQWTRVDDNGISGDGQRQLQWQQTRVDGVSGGETMPAAVADKKWNQQKLGERWDCPTTMKGG